MRLGRWMAGGALALTVTSAAFALGPDDTTAARQVLVKAAGAYDRQDCRTAIKLARPLIDRAEPVLDGKILAVAYEIVAVCEYRTDQVAKAKAHTLRATALSDSSDYLWQLRLMAQIEDEQDAAAVETVEKMMLGRGAALNGMKPLWLWRLNRHVIDSGADVLTLRVAKAMADTAYQPDDVTWERPDAQVIYARALAKANDVAGAKAALAGADTLTAMLQIVFDPTLSPLLSGQPDLRAVAERQLERDRDIMLRHGDSLNAVIVVARDLRHLGRPAESLALLQSLQPRLADPKAFADAGEQMIWWWDGLGRGYAAIGDYDSMIAAFRQGSEKIEVGLPNVSQTINLASFQLDFGHPDAALKTLAVFEGVGRKASPYGDMQVRGVQGCAYARLGDTARAAAVLKDALAKQKDDPSAVTDLYLCNGDIDAAAASYIARLDDPKLRVLALMDLSAFDPRDARAPVDPKLAPLALVKARDDVRAAIARAGGTRVVHLQGAEL